MARKSKAKRQQQQTPSRRVANPPSQQGGGAREATPYATVGKDLGSLVGFGDLGQRLGGAVGRLFGRGDYTLQTNSLVESYGLASAGPPPPMTFRDGKRGTRVVEREFLGDIVSGSLSGGSTVFDLRALAINPAMSQTFPWLSTIAQQFDQWEPHGIVFEFRSTSSEFNGTSQALGVVVLATDYDSLDSSYATKIEMENSDYAMSVKAADSAVHGIECDMTERPTRVLYTREGPPPTGADLRMYDLGNFQIASKGMSVADVTLGELWVSYDITFYKKQLHGILARSHPALYIFSDDTGIDTSNYFGLLHQEFWLNFDYPPTGLHLGGDTVSLPDHVSTGRYHWSYLVAGTSSSTIAAVTVTLTNCVAAPNTPPHFDGAHDIGTGRTVLYQTGTFDVTAPGASVTFSGGTLPGSANEMHYELYQIDDDDWHGVTQ